MSQDQSPLGQQLRQQVEARLANGEMPSAFYAIYAPVLSIRGDIRQSIVYLRKAIELNSEDSYSLNNLAYCLFQTGPQSDEEALQLVNRALKIEPDEPLYRETRGQLLIRLGRLREGIDDLTYALNGLGDTPEIHAALAAAYEQLGEKEQAAIHRNRPSASF